MFPEIYNRLRLRKLHIWYLCNDLEILGVIQFLFTIGLVLYGMWYCAKELKAAGTNQHILNAVWMGFMLWCWIGSRRK